MLDALDERTFETLKPQLVRRELGIGETIYEPQQRYGSVFFPLDCVLSMILRMNDGDEIEVGTIGYEGFSCAEALLGSDRAPTLVVCQVPGAALALPFDAFVDLVGRHDDLRARAERYARYLQAFMSQTIACNRLHALPARAARWLLTTADRTKSDTFAITQEYLSILLGVHRQAVSVAAAALQHSGLIAYRRGRVSIADRAGLEAVSCECYAATNDALERLSPA